MSTFRDVCLALSVVCLVLAWAVLLAPGPKVTPEHKWFLLATALILAKLSEGGTHE